MPTLLSPFPPPPSPTTAIAGRTFDGYARLFGFDPARLRGRAVLEVAAGCSSFTAEACRRGMDAVAVDSLYHQPAASLAAGLAIPGGREAGGDSNSPFAQAAPAGSAADPDFPSPVQRFLADYEAQARRGRYVRGALPSLPFLDGAFDFVICAHRLFAAAGPRDFSWQLAACVELVRVTTGEARIHSTDRPNPGFSRLRRELRGLGIVARLVIPDAPADTGDGRVLVLARAA